MCVSLGKNDMIVRMQYLHFDGWAFTKDLYSNKARELYRDSLLLQRLIIKSMMKQNRRLGL